MSDNDPIAPTPEPAPQPAPAVPPSTPYAAAPPYASAPAPAKPKSRAGMFFIGALSGCTLLVLGVMFLAFIGVMAGRNGSTEVAFGDKIAVVPIEGEILESREALEALHRYAKQSSVKGIVIRINSPGGAIAPSQEIYEEIRKTRQRSGKPIVASLDSVAASGGFYIAAACDEIVANPGSITGSIGVILQWMDVKDLLAWAKLKPETIISGPMKDAGSPYRELTDAERAYFQRIVTQLRGQFVHAVAEGRKGKLSEQQVDAIADGRVFTGEEALQLKLVDRLGNLDDAVRATAKLAGMHGEPDLIYPKKRHGGLFELLGSSDDTESAIERIVSRRMPKFLFHW